MSVRERRIIRFTPYVLTLENMSPRWRIASHAGRETLQSSTVTKRKKHVWLLGTDYPKCQIRASAMITCEALPHRLATVVIITVEHIRKCPWKSNKHDRNTDSDSNSADKNPLPFGEWEFQLARNHITNMTPFEVLGEDDRGAASPI